jgi:hypothetical protein
LISSEIHGSSRLVNVKIGAYFADCMRRYGIFVKRGTAPGKHGSDPCTFARFTTGNKGAGSGVLYVHETKGSDERELNNKHQTAIRAGSRSREVGGN